MRVTICAIGRLRQGPEKDLTGRYLKLFTAAGKQIGITAAELIEIDERKTPKDASGQDWQSQRLLERVTGGAFVIALDERGTAMSSPDFAASLEGWCRNHRDVAFLIGGADGHGARVLERAHMKLSLGPATWPHMLARILLLEQLYRAACIGTGHPYHHG